MRSRVGQDLVPLPALLLPVLAATLVLALLAGSSHAGLPDPSRSVFEIRGQGAPCQFRFRVDGFLDHLTVLITLRDPFDSPVTNCSTSTTIELVGPSDGGAPCGYTQVGSGELCSCCDLRQAGVSDADGVLMFEFSRIGGRGKAQVAVTTHCNGNYGVGTEEFLFTSADMNGTCESEPLSSTTIIDFAIYAACIPPSPICRPTDFDCDCTASIIDLAYYAGGLLRGCTSADCP